MTTIEIGARTAEQIVSEALGGQITERNWSDEGSWSFDDAVLKAACRVRQTLTSTEEERVAADVSIGTAIAYTLGVLGDGPDSDIVTARLIVAMHYRVSYAENKGDALAGPDGGTSTEEPPSPT